MKVPRVSVCIPCLNTRDFLEDRRDSVDLQTFRDFEVIIVDDGSTDGSWQFFEEWADLDQRVSLHQGPRNGLYPGWNDAIQRAKGEFVYIATSDDTMAPNFLAEMVAALDRNPDCGMAHCNLRAFRDESPGSEMEWWRQESPFALSVDGRVDESHRRMAPGDGLLHGCGASVYVSTTQLLTRREIFETVGGFSDKWGVIGDFEWAMRVGLTTNVVHVPTTWGGWRIHERQATNTAGDATAGRRARNLEVYASVIDSHKDLPSIAEALPGIVRRRTFLEMRSRFRELRGEGSSRAVGGFVLGHPDFFFQCIRDWLIDARQWRWSDERVMIEELKRSVRWIEKG